MTRIVKTLLLLLAVPAAACVQWVSAAEPRTENTYQLVEGESPPAATLEDALWLVGAWKGTAFGQQFEENWNPPSAGSMVGMFKLMDGDEVSFYELLLLTVEDGTLSLKVKHFSPDFTAWEEKGDFIDFRLVKLGEDELHFSGISFYRRSEDAMDGYIVMRNADGIREEPLVYKRRD
jgi:hypothetical protein